MRNQSIARYVAIATASAISSGTLKQPPPTKTSTAAEPRLLFPGMFYGVKWQHDILEELDYTVHRSAYMLLHRGRRIAFQGWL